MKGENVFLGMFVVSGIASGGAEHDALQRAQLALPLPF